MMPGSTSPELNAGGFEPITVDEIQKRLSYPLTGEQVQAVIDRYATGPQTADYTDRKEIVQNVLNVLSRSNDSDFNAVDGKVVYQRRMTDEDGKAVHRNIDLDAPSNEI